MTSAGRLGHADIDVLQEILAFATSKGDGKVVPGRVAGRNLKLNLLTRGRCLRRAGLERGRGRRGHGCCRGLRGLRRGRPAAVFRTDAGGAECECKQEYNQSSQRPGLHRPSMVFGIFHPFDMPTASLERKGELSGQAPVQGSVCRNILYSIGRKLPSILMRG